MEIEVCELIFWCLGTIFNVVHSFHLCPTMLGDFASPVSLSSHGGGIALCSEFLPSRCSGCVSWWACRWLGTPVSLSLFLPELNLCCPRPGAQLLAWQWSVSPAPGHRAICPKWRWKTWVWLSYMGKLGRCQRKNLHGHETTTDHLRRLDEVRAAQGLYTCMPLDWRDFRDPWLLAESLTQPVGFLGWKQTAESQKCSFQVTGTTIKDVKGQLY